MENDNFILTADLIGSIINKKVTVAQAKRIVAVIKMLESAGIYPSWDEIDSVLCSTVAYSLMKDLEQMLPKRIFHKGGRLKKP